MNKLDKAEMNEGWLWLYNSTKWHYFVDNKSICKKFALFASSGRKFEIGNDNSKDNCTTCRRIREKQAIPVPDGSSIKIL